jgi:hypothetical protein
MLRWPVQELHGIAPDVGREVRVAKRHVHRRVAEQLLHSLERHAAHDEVRTKRDPIRKTRESGNGETGERRTTARRRRRAIGLNGKDRTLLASCRYLTLRQIQTVLGGPRDVRTLENRLRALAGDTGNVKLPDVGAIVLRSSSGRRRRPATSWPRATSAAR